MILLIYQICQTFLSECQIYIYSILILFSEYCTVSQGDTGPVGPPGMTGEKGCKGDMVSCLMGFWLGKGR